MRTLRPRSAGRVCAYVAGLLFACQLPVESARAAVTIPVIDAYQQTIQATGVGQGINVAIALDTGTRASPSPILGELQDIRISFFGTIAFSIASGLNTVQNGPAVTPVPYTISPALSIEIDSLFGLYDLSAFRLTGRYDASGLGESTVLTGTYAFSFSYFDLLDQFIGPQNVASGGATNLLPPVSLAGNLAGFLPSVLPSVLPSDLRLTYELSFAETPRVLAVPTVVDVTSTLQVTTSYTYELVEPPDPVEVPEPDARYLLLLGFMMLAWTRRVTVRLH